jgi:hypothetical protein
MPNVFRVLAFISISRAESGSAWVTNGPEIRLFYENVSSSGSNVKGSLPASRPKLLEQFGTPVQVLLGTQAR